MPRLLEQLLSSWIRWLRKCLSLTWVLQSIRLDCPGNACWIPHILIDFIHLLLRSASPQPLSQGRGAKIQFEIKTLWPSVSSLCSLCKFFKSHRHKSPKISAFPLCPLRKPLCPLRLNFFYHNPEYSGAKFARRTQRVPILLNPCHDAFLLANT